MQYLVLSMSQLSPSFLKGALLLGILLPFTSMPSSCLGAEGTWSNELLRDVLETKATREKPAQARSTEGFILKTYQFQHLRIAEPGRAQDLLKILQNLLPEGSALRQDPQANSIHLLSSRPAHAAAWDFISTVDVPSSETRIQNSELSPVLQDLLTKLGELRQDTRQSSAQLQQLKTELAADLERNKEEQQRKLLQYTLLSLGLFGLGGLVLWGFRSGRNKRDNKVATTDSTAPIQRSGHELLKTDHSLGAQRELQKEMMSVLNAAAIRMEAWYNEQKQQGEKLALANARQQEQLVQAQEALTRMREEFRSDGLQFIEAAGRRFEDSQQRMEENVKGLGLQQGRVEALASELRTTVGELDQVRDEMLRLHRELESKGVQLDHTREKLSQREQELCHQQAKLAALTMLLEEEGSDSLPNEAPKNRDAADNNTAEILDISLSNSKSTQCNQATNLRFTFLPPNHPEGN